MRLNEAIGILQSRGAVSQPQDFVFREAMSSANEMAWSGQTNLALQTCIDLMLNHLPAFERNPKLARSLMETLVLCHAHGQLQRLIRALFGIEVKFISQIESGDDPTRFTAGLHDGRYYIGVSDTEIGGPDCLGARLQTRGWCDRLYNLVATA